MLIFKITLSIYGENFFPSRLLSLINEEYVHESLRDANDDLTHGVIYYMHPKIFGVQGEGTMYEEWFVELLENNFEIFRKHGAEDIDLFIEVYYSGEQCNFEIFNKPMLNRINNFNVAIPISIYHFSEGEILSLLN